MAVRPPVAVSIQTTQEVYRLLGELAETGLFGTTPEAVAEELLRLQLRAVQVEGWPRVGGPMGPGTALRQNVLKGC